MVQCATRRRCNAIGLEQGCPCLGFLRSDLSWLEMGDGQSTVPQSAAAGKRPSTGGESLGSCPQPDRPNGGRACQPGTVGSVPDGVGPPGNPRSREGAQE